MLLPRLVWVIQTMQEQEQVWMPLQVQLVQVVLVQRHIVLPTLVLLLILNPSCIGRALSMRLVLLTRGSSIPVSAASSSALRLTAACLSGLCVVDNPSLRRLKHATISVI